MLNRFFQFIVGLTLFLPLAGCSTLETKFGNRFRDEYNLKPQVGHVYTGIVDAMALSCFVDAPWVKKPIAIVSIPINIIGLLIDIPISLVTDTLFLPIDLANSPQYHRQSFDDYCSYHSKSHESDPVTKTLPNQEDAPDQKPVR